MSATVNNTAMNQNAQKPIGAIPTSVEKIFGNSLSPFIRKDVKVYKLDITSENTYYVDIPKEDPHFIFDPTILVDLIVFARSSKQGAGMLLSGPTGSGKSEIVRQFCSKLNMPMTFAVASRDTTINDLIGGLGLVNGATYFREGPLLKAMRRGYWFRLDEIDLLEPSVSTALNLILDGHGYLIPETSEYIPIHPLFKFIATANTFGGGDSYEYAGTQKMNAALIDRLFKVAVDYPAPNVEKEILDKISPNTMVFHDKAIEFANRVRMSHKENEVSCSVAISTRNLISWMLYSAAYKDFDVSGDAKLYCLKRTILNSCDETTKNTILSLYSSLVK